MAVMDLYLSPGADELVPGRGVTDLLLQAGPDSGEGPPPVLFGSGMLTSTASLVAGEALAGSDAVAAIAVLGGNGALADARDLVTVALLDHRVVSTDGGALVTVAALAGMTVLADRGVTQTTTVLSALDALAQGGALTGVAAFAAIEALAQAGALATLAVLAGRAELVAGGPPVLSGPALGGYSWEVAGPRVVIAAAGRPVTPWTGAAAGPGAPADATSLPGGARGRTFPGYVVRAPTGRAPGSHDGHGGTEGEFNAGDPAAGGRRNARPGRVAR